MNVGKAAAGETVRIGGCAVAATGVSVGLPVVGEPVSSEASLQRPPSLLCSIGTTHTHRGNLAQRFALFSWPHAVNAVVTGERVGERVGGTVGRRVVGWSVGNCVGARVTPTSSSHSSDQS